MEENKQFRTAGFGGFHRQDVIDYIEHSAKANQARQSELEEQLKAAQAELSEKSQALEAAQQQLEVCKFTLTQVKADMQQLKEDTAKQTAEFDRQKQAYADIELSARQRAAKLEEEAQAEYDRIIAEAQSKADALISDAEVNAREQTSALQQEIGRLEAQRRTLLRDSRSELEKNAAALKAGVSISLDELSRVRQTLEALSGSFDGSLAVLDKVCTEEA